MIQKEITFFGEQTILACDGKCEKAWGINNRPRVQLSDDPDDYAIFSDDETDLAPDDPGTYEGGHGKPTSYTNPEAARLNKWCARECERSGLFEPGEPIDLTDFSQRYYNKPPHERDHE